MAISLAHSSFNPTRLYFIHLYCHIVIIMILHISKINSMLIPTTDSSLYHPKSLPRLVIEFMKF